MKARAADRGLRFSSARPSGTAALARQRGRVDTVVGLTMIESMMMTPGAQANEMSRIDHDMHSFNAELTEAAHAHGADVSSAPAMWPPSAAALAKAKALGAEHSDPVIAFYRDVWLSLYYKWVEFYAANKDGAWWSNPVSEAEKYQDQLIELREKAAGLGVKLLTPGPKQEHPEGLPSWLLPVGVGVGGLVVLSLLARN